jgi:hypothetical protein
MRVKKLSANRRHKPGDDDSAIAGGEQEQRRWVSPTKPRDDAASSSSAATESSVGADSGASSPSDPYSVHPVELQDGGSASVSASPSRFQLDQDLFPRTGGASLMAKNMAPQVVAAQDARSSGNFDAAKPRSWQDVVDTAVRETMHAKIVEILRALKPNAPEKVLERVPGLAYRMEESLFRMAASEGEYRDFATLPQRLAHIQEASAKRLLQQQSAPGNAHAAPARGASGAAAAPPRVVLTEDQARVVFQCLQTWRQKLVNMYGVAPWEILPNQALAKVALHLPSNEQELAVCGVEDGQIARFGSSLLQELQQICNVWTNASSKYNATPAAGRGAAKMAGRKAEGSKRPATDAAGANKRRKGSASSPGDASFSSGSARLAPAPALNYSTSAGSSTSAPLLSNSQILFRAPGIDSLPTLLSSASAANGAGKKAFAAPNAGRLSPSGQVLHPPLFSRIDGGRQEHSHMHLLAQGAGQVSKQQQEQPALEQPNAEAYEKEIQTLRWLLHQSQQEKSQLEAEVQHLRQQLGGGPHPSHLSA